MVFSYLPQAKFAFPQSYAAQFCIADETNNVTRAGNVFTVHLPALPGYQHIYTVNPKVLTWSSNRYTLDYVMLDCSWRWDGDPGYHAQSCLVEWVHLGPDALPTLLARNPFDSTALYTLRLPPPPPSYWRSDFL